MTHASVYYQHPTVVAVARVLIDGGWAKEGGSPFLRRCLRVRLEVTGADDDPARVRQALLASRFLPGETDLVADIIRAVQDAPDELGII